MKSCREIAEEDTDRFWRPIDKETGQMIALDVNDMELSVVRVVEPTLILIKEELYEQSLG